jgi:hypothetical protein
LTDTSLATLEHAISARVAARGWALKINKVFVDEKIAARLAVGNETDTDGEGYALPSSRRAYDLSPTFAHLLVCAVGEDADLEYRRALWWAALIRSQIAPKARADLHLLLVAPEATEFDAGWRARAIRWEADQRFCRKFVWLPSANPTKDVGTLIDRTFLATPWTGEVAEPRSLDPLRSLSEELAAKGTLPVTLIDRWFEVLASDESSATQIAEGLVRLMELEG